MSDLIDSKVDVVAVLLGGSVLANAEIHRRLPRGGHRRWPRHRRERRRSSLDDLGDARRGRARGGSSPCHRRKGGAGAQHRVAHRLTVASNRQLPRGL